MNTRSYKVIFFLLSLCVLSIIALQGFWLNNFYKQKMEQFNGTVYSALEQVGVKLKERGTLQAVKEKIFINKTDLSSSKKKLKSNPLKGNGRTRKLFQTSYSGGNSSNLTVTADSVVLVTSDNVQEYRLESSINENKQKAGSYQVRIISSKPAPALQILNTDSAQMLLKSRMKKLAVDSILNEETRQVIRKKEMEKLMDKMFMEIEVIDKEEKNSDTIKNIISKVFENKGLFLPFEFALKKEKDNKTKIITGSDKYNDSLGSFISDLSLNNVFTTSNYLYVQFPGAGNYVFSSMKRTLLLSLIFSLLIFSVFLYTARLILRQKKISEIKNDFVNNMTHELKTPIATISLAIDAMNNPQIKNNEERFSDYSRILKEENQKLNHHVERVLQMSLIEKGQLQLNRTKANIIEILRSTIKNYALQIEEKKAEVKFKPDREEIFIRADREHFASVFSNLLDNALKYSSADCSLEMSVIEFDKTLEIIFKDNGIGIDGRQQEKIFEKFYRVQGGNLHDVKGFGLGLSYVKSIVEAHGGTIDLQSEIGKGTTFKVVLKKDA